MKNGYSVILTGDRSQLSNYRFNFLFGFLSCGPVKVAPEPIYSMICPTKDTYDHTTGELTAAPLGLRRIQTALEDYYGKENVVAQHPFYLDAVVGPKTKIVGVSEMSPLGLGPVDTAYSWNNVTWNRMWFTRLTSHLKRLKEKYGFKVVVGGPGAWQLLDFQRITADRIDPVKKKIYGVDHVVLGEADVMAPIIFGQIMEDDAPEVIKLSTSTISSVDEIPEIRYPTLTGTIECMRGCGRGCDFCSPNLRMKRDFPAERVAREAAINIRYGYKAVWLQTEELFLYGCKNRDMWPNEEAIVELYQALFNAGAILVGATHWTFAGVAAAPNLIKKLSQMNGLSPSKWIGVQPGLEFASPRLIKRFMPYKVKPFSCEEYPEVVRAAMKIMNQNYYYPAATLIIGHPGEEPDEVEMTVDLVRTLSEKDKIHGILAPLLYVDYFRPHQTVHYEDMNEHHWKLLYFCWKHNVKEFKKRIWTSTQSMGFITRAVSITGTYLLSSIIMRFIKDAFWKKFRRIPSWMS